MSAKETASRIAEFLLQIKAIRLQPNQPFTWASGWKSPIYCDNRISLSHPKVRTFIRQALTKSIEEEFGKPDLIAGVATAAIPQGALVAEAMGLPFVYVRSAPKDHGRENLIEGEWTADQSVVVIEDLVSTGQSSIKAVDALRAGGCNVKGLICIFNYGFDVAVDNFQKADCPIVSLCTFDTLLEIAVRTNYVSASDIATLNDWRMAPEGWGKSAHV